MKNLSNQAHRNSPPSVHIAASLPPAISSHEGRPPAPGADGSSSSSINEIFVPSFAGLRLFLYTEVSPENKQGFEYGVFLFNAKGKPCSQESVLTFKKFKLSALLNRDYYTLAKEAIFELGCNEINTLNSIKKLSRQISDQFSSYGINFIRNHRVKVSDLPILAFVIDILMIPKEDTGDPGDAMYIRKRSRINYVRDQTLEERRLISYRDGLVNRFESKALVHVYLKNLEVEDDENIDVDELKLFLDALRKWSISEFKEEFQLGLAEIPNPNPIFQVKVPPSLRCIDIDQYLAESDDTCCICLEELLSEGVVQIAQLVRCKHVYHTHCVSNWIQTNPSCPICRSCSQTILI